MQRQPSIMQLLAQAHAGDEDAHRQVAMHCYERFLPRLIAFYSRDPSIDLEDLKSTFFEGIWHGVLRDKGLGDPLYYIGQCGWWAVASEVKQVQRRMKHRSLFVHSGCAHISSEQDEMLGETVYDTVDPYADQTDLIVSRVDAEHQIRIICNADLDDRSHQILAILITGCIGYPDDPGFNKRLADKLGVCPQRASQCMQKLRSRAQQALQA